MTKLFALILALLMCSAALAELPDYINTDSELPLIKEGHEVELDIVALGRTDFGEPENIWFWKYVEDKMNLKVNVTASMDIETFKSLAFASNELPDVFVTSGFTTAQLVQYGDTEGQLIDLMPYVNEEYMPNFYRMTQEMPDLLSRITTADGKLYSLPQLEGANLKGVACHNAGARFFVDTTLLEELDMEMPATLDELIEFLAAVKEAHPEMVPLGGSANANHPGSLILIAMGYLTADAWGLTPSFKDGEVVIPAGDRELYGEYLTVMKQLWDEGLIEKDFFTLDGSAVESKMAQNLYSVFSNVAYLYLPDSFQDWWHIEPLTSEWNETPQWPSASINLDSTAITISVGGFVITSSCEEEKIAAALRFADWFYGENSVNFGLQWWGPTAQMVEEQNIGYGITKGWVMDPETRNYVYLDTNDATQDYAFRCENIFGMHSGSGWGNALYSNTVPQVMAGFESDPSMLTVKLSETNGDDHYRISEIEMVRDHLKTIYPTLTFFAPEDVAAINDYKLLITDYVKEETAKFITGLRPLSEIDSYFDALEAMGFNEWLAYYVDYYEALNG